MEVVQVSWRGGAAVTPSCVASAWSSLTTSTPIEQARTIERLRHDWLLQ